MECLGRATELIRGKEGESGAVELRGTLCNVHRGVLVGSTRGFHAFICRGAFAILSGTDCTGQPLLKHRKNSVPGE